jgi:hypothetical protein
MFLSPEDQHSIVARACLAPSVHNTQPVRWHFAADGSIWILTDPTRWLRAGDPRRRDMGVSAGAAVEGTMLACSQNGLSLVALEQPAGDKSPIEGLEIAARLVLRAGAAVHPLAIRLPQRSTFRGRFSPADKTQCSTLSGVLAGDPSVTLVTDQPGIAVLAALNDRASLTFFRDAAFRRELLQWMRLSGSHPKWDRDGLNARALGLGRVEAWGAGLVLSDPIFPVLDQLGLAGLLTGEAEKTKSAAAIALFHRPVGESPLETGLLFLEFLLKVTAAGFSAWPMAVIADDPASAAEATARFAIPRERRLINAFRLGLAPKSYSAARARLPVRELIV